MKKLLSLVLILMLLFSAVPMTAFAAEGDLAPTGASYDLWVGDTQVTDANKDDILYDGGRAQFDPMTNTLTLHNPTIDSFYDDYADNYYYGKIYAGSIGIFAENMDLTISGCYYMSPENPAPTDGITVRGGNLTLNGKFIIQAEMTGIIATGYYNPSLGHLAIAGGFVEVGSSYGPDYGPEYGIAGDYVTISSDVEYVKAFGGYHSIKCFYDDIRIESPLSVVTPAGGKNIGGEIYQSDGTTRAHQVEIGKNDVKRYNLWVGSERVTDKNKSNILGGRSAIFDSDTNTLILNSPTIPDSMFGSKIYSFNNNLTVKGSYHMTEAETKYGIRSCNGSLTLDGSFTFLSEDNAVFSDGSLTVSGSSLTAKSSKGSGLSSVNDITVGSVRTLTSEGELYGMTAEGNITFSGGIITVKSNSHSGICAKKDIFIESGVMSLEAEAGMSALYANNYISIDPKLKIFTPSGGVSMGGNIYHSNGSKVATHVVIKPNTYTVSFNANSGYGTMRSVSVSYGAYYTLPACTFTNTGYVFSGWSVDGSKYSPGDKIKIFKDTTVFAQWKSNKATVSFDANGGTRTMASSTVTNGDSFMLPGCSFLPPSGYQFQSWRVGDLYYQPGDYITVNGDTVVYAQWCNPTMIESVNVTITAPEAGKRVSFQVKKDNSSCMFNTDVTNGTGLEFRDQTANDWMSAGEVFVKDRVYTANVYLITPSTGKFDSNVKVTINGHNASVMMLTNSMIIASYDFTASDTPEEGEKILLGDADTDGSVTIFDATAIQRHLAELPVKSFSEKAADADEDGDVTIFDATAIQRYLAELPSNPNIGKPV